MAKKRKHQPTLKNWCDEIAAELNRRGIVVTNRVTGRVVRTGDDVFNFSSHGELFHIYEWHADLFPEQHKEPGPGYF